MKGLLMMLKSLGIDIQPAEIERLRVGIPELIIHVKNSVENFDMRLKAIEAAIARIESQQPYEVRDAGTISRAN